MDRPIYSSTQFRHPKEGHFNSHRVKPPLSAQRTHQVNEWAAHTNQRLLGSNVKKRGNIKRSALGECSQRKDTRVETANEGGFSSQICSERVDVSQLLNRLTQFTTINLVMKRVQQPN